MHVYLVRHGEAKSEEVDPERHLSERGVRDVERVTDFCRKLNIEVEAICHSGKARAEQTANILARSIASASGVQQRDDIGATDPVEPIAEELTAGERNVMLVGHLPFMARLSGVLLDARDDSLKFHAGTVACMHYGRKHGWRLWWSMAPDLLK